MRMKLEDELTTEQDEQDWSEVVSKTLGVMLMAR